MSVLIFALKLTHRHEKSSVQQNFAHTLCKQSSNVLLYLTNMTPKKELNVNKFVEYCTLKIENVEM